MDFANKNSGVLKCSRCPFIFLAVFAGDLKRLSHFVMEKSNSTAPELSALRNLLSNLIARCEIWQTKKLPAKEILLIKGMLSGYQVIKFFLDQLEQRPKK